MFCFIFHTCCFCDKLKFEVKTDIVELMDKWCLGAYRHSKTGYSVIYISLYVTVRSVVPVMVCT